MRKSRRSLIVVLSLVLAASMLASVPAAAQSGEDEPEDRKVLVFSKTAGFRHASIPDGIAMVERLGAEHGFAVDATEDATRFTEENLAQYDTVIWLSTTGDVLNEDQEEAFEHYIQRGGGYTGIHAAADTEYDWPWYGGLVGAYFASHPPGTPDATVVVEDREHPSTDHLPERWDRTDEWYNYQSNPRDQVHVLATVDESTYDPGDGAMGEDHPIAWCQNYDGGRAWYTGGGHTSESFSERDFVEHVLGGIQTAAGWVDADCSTEQSARFVKTTLDGEVVEPMSLAVLPDGRILYTERTGLVEIWHPGTRAITQAAQVPVFTGSEDGLLGIIEDPDFAENNWVYMYYSPLEGDPRNRLSRFTLAGDQIDLGSEVVLLEVGTQRQECCHAGGNLDFGPDGNLYLATGDNTNPFESDGYTPIDEREGREPWDAQKSASNTNDLRGKLIRITPTDTAEGGYTIPEGNLFPPGTERTRPEIYAMGFRNPFRFDIDPETGWVHLADYGPDAQEPDPDRGPAGYVEFNVVREAGNFGWPYCHGNNFAYHDYDFATGESGPEFDCAAPVNDSPNNTGLTELPPAQPPVIWYTYTLSEEFPELGTGGGGPMSGPVYHFDPEIDNDTKIPEEYDGQAFIYEWTRDWIKTLELDENGDLVAINDFADNVPLAGPMDMEFGPDGTMYLLEYGKGFFTANPEAGLYQIEWITGSLPPIAEATATPTNGAVPLEVAFSSDLSRDPEGGEITYAWDLDGDGEVDSTEPNPTHTYTEPGDYTATLTVTGPEGKTGQVGIAITAGNTAPEIEFVQGVDGGFFTFGDEIPYEVVVTDAEDGSTADGTIDCELVSVGSALGHAEHAHPFDSATGCDGVIQTIADDAHAGATDLFYVLTASYTDEGAEGVSPLTTIEQAVLNPRRLEAEAFDAASGVQVEDTGDVGGGQNIGFIEDGDWVSYEPVNLYQIDSVTFRVASAGAGGRIEMRLDSPDGELVGTAEVSPTGGWQAWTDVTVNVTDPGGTHELFLVFRNEEAGDQSLFNVNWLNFNGKGVASNARPTVSITSPEAGAELPSDEPIEVTAEAADSDGQVTLVEFFANGEKIGEDAEAPFSVTWEGAEAGLYTLTAVATDDAGFSTTSSPVDVTVGDVSVKEPYQTFASTEADFLQIGDEFTIIANGADVWTGVDEYGAIYLDDAGGEQFVATTQVTSQQDTNPWAKAGIMARDDITQAGASPGYAMISITPGNDVSFQWDGDGDGFLDASVQAGETTYPIWLRLERNGDTYTGSFSTDGETFEDVGSVTLEGAETQDVGMFSTSHATGTTGRVTFAGGLDVGQPAVTATAEPTEGQAPLEVHFTGTAADPNATLTWDFGVDGATAEGPEATYTYTEPGMYTATLTATSADGETASDSVEINVTAPCTDPAEPDEGFRMLFDGTAASLEDWSQAGPGGFTHDGCVIESFGGLGLLWYSADQFESYVLRLDWRLSDDADNSGVFVGFPDPGDDPWVAVEQGYEIQIDPQGAPDGAPEHLTGAIYDFQGPDVEAMRAAVNPPGEWNTYDIRVSGDTITVTLNGTVINEFTSTDESRDLSQGYIGIQNHGDNDAVSFGDVQIMPVDDEPDDTTPPEVTITGVERRVYGDSEDLEIGVEVSDDSGEDADIEVTLDGEPFEPGELELWRLDLGIHELTVTATDAAGNTASESVVFATVTSFRDLRTLVRDFGDDGWLAGDRTQRLMTRRLARAQRQVSRDRDRAAIRSLERFKDLAADVRRVTNREAQHALLRDADALIVALGGQPRELGGGPDVTRRYLRSLQGNARLPGER